VLELARQIAAAGLREPLAGILGAPRLALLGSLSVTGHG
jgi:hypothetical protein